MDDAGNGRRADMGDQLVVVFLGGSDRILIIVFLPVFVTGHDLYYPAAIMFFQSGTKVVAGMEKEGVAGRAGSGIDGGRKRFFLPDEVVEERVANFFMNINSINLSTSGTFFMVKLIIFPKTLPLISTSSRSKPMVPDLWISFFILLV